MNYKAHKIGGTCSGVIASALLFKGNTTALTLCSSALLIAGANIGSVMPDIDKPTSKVGKKLLFKPISIVLNKTFGHRTVTHSLLLSLIFLSLLIGSSYIFVDNMFYLYSNFTIGFSIGYLSHLLMDSMTVQGIPVLYPFVKKKYRIAKFKTEKHEEVMSTLCLILTAFMLYLIYK
jgi:inner membrane protein